MQVAGMAWGERKFFDFHAFFARIWEFPVLSSFHVLGPLTLAIAQAAAVESPRQCQPEDSSS